MEKDLKSSKMGYRKKLADRKRTEIRFLDDGHHDLVADAAHHRGLTLNSWLVDVTLAAARKELRAK